jgi:hypothetical protein
MKMLRPFSVFAVLLAVVVFTNGCAFSRTQVQVALAPTYREPLQANAPVALELGKFKDSRPVNEPDVLLHKANQYGATSGSWVAQKPVADLLRDGVEHALKENRFKLGDAAAAKYELRGDLQEFGFNNIAGLWTAKVKPRMQVRFELIDKSNGNSVWRDTFIGRGELETAWGSSETIVSLFKLGVDDLIRQLVSDPNFRKLCEGK